MAQGIPQQIQLIRRRHPFGAMPHLLDGAFDGKEEDPGIGAEDWMANWLGIIEIFGEFDL